MFFNGEIIIENVVLGTQAKARTDFVDVMPNVKPIHECRSTRRWEKPCIVQQQRSHHKSTSNHRNDVFNSFYQTMPFIEGGSVAEWLACWTQAQKGLGSNRSRDAVG